MPRPLLIISQLDSLIQIVDINPYTEWQTVQIQISWLLQKPTDLDLYCLQRQGLSGFSRTRVKSWGHNNDSGFIFNELNICSSQIEASQTLHGTRHCRVTKHVEKDGCVCCVITLQKLGVLLLINNIYAASSHWPPRFNRIGWKL